MKNLPTRSLKFRWRFFLFSSLVWNLVLADSLGLYLQSIVQWPCHFSDFIWRESNLGPRFLNSDWYLPSDSFFIAKSIFTKKNFLLNLMLQFFNNESLYFGVHEWYRNRAWNPPTSSLVRYLVHMRHPMLNRFSMDLKCHLIFVQENNKQNHQSAFR